MTENDLIGKVAKKYDSTKEPRIKELHMECDLIEPHLVDECWFRFDVSDPQNWKVLSFVICDKHLKQMNELFLTQINQMDSRNTRR